MKIGILCAGDSELAPFLPEMQGVTIAKKAMLTFYEGKIRGVEVVALYSGVCKVNAALAAQILAGDFGVDALINAGVAGGIDSRLSLFDVAVSAESAYYDVAEDILTEFHPWLESIFFPADERLLAAVRKGVQSLGWKDRVYFGRMVTGETFIADSGRKEIIEKFAPLTVDMETAGIAHVCYVNKIPFVAIRCISDTAEHSGISAFEENCAKASKMAMQVTVATLQEVERLFCCM